MTCDSGSAGLIAKAGNPAGTRMARRRYDVVSVAIRRFETDAACRKGGRDAGRIEIRDAVRQDRDGYGSAPVGEWMIEDESSRPSSSRRMEDLV